MGGQIIRRYEEDELLPISGLQHLVFCERRAALIILERLWRDNLLTAEGSVLHEQTHQVETECRGTLRIVRGLWLRSTRLGLCGRSDVIELQRLAGSNGPAIAVPLPGTEGLWQPFPVEYKRGQLRGEASFEVQLCAQALCLEEMLGVNVPGGAIYYGKTRRRLEIPFGRVLRDKTTAAANRLHELASARITPRAQYRAKCRSCSLVDVCLPKAMNPRRDVKRYLAGAAGPLETHL